MDSTTTSSILIDQCSIGNGHQHGRARNGRIVDEGHDLLVKGRGQVNAVVARGVVVVNDGLAVKKVIRRGDIAVVLVGQENVNERNFAE